MKVSCTEYISNNNLHMHLHLGVTQERSEPDIKQGTLICIPRSNLPNTPNSSSQVLHHVSVSDGWKELSIDGVQVHAQLQDDGCLQLRKVTLVSDNKVARYCDRVDGLQHELKERLADVAAIDVELQQLLVQMEKVSDDNQDTFSEITVRTHIKGMHKDRIKIIRELTKLNVRYEKTTNTETLMVRSNCVTCLKWAGSSDESKVVWVTGGEVETEAENVQGVMEEVSTFPVCFSEEPKTVCVVGGSSNNSSLKSMECYDVDANSWSVMPSELREERKCLATCVLEGNMFVVGGSGVGRSLHDVDRYNLKTGVWSRMSNMRNARRGHCALVLGGFVYALGGRGSWQVIDIVERYDVSANTWSNVAPMPTARAYSGACVLEGCIFVYGGMDRPNSFLSSVERYDPDTDTWSEVASMGKVRACVSGAVLGGYIYVCGGGDEQKIPQQSVERYDHETNKWVEVASMLVAREGHSVVACGSHLYSIGGVDDNGVYMSSVERYDPVEDKWESMSNMGGEKCYMGAC